MIGFFNLAIFIHHGDNILAAGGDNDHLIIPHGQHRPFIAEIGATLAPPAGSLFQGQLVEMGFRHVPFDVAAVTLGNPGGVAGLTTHSFVAGKVANP